MPLRVTNYKTSSFTKGCKSNKDLFFAALSLHSFLNISDEVLQLAHKIPPLPWSFSYPGGTCPEPDHQWILACISPLPGGRCSCFRTFFLRSLATDPGAPGKREYRRRGKSDCF